MEEEVLFYVPVCFDENSWLHPVQHVTMRLDKEKDFSRRRVGTASEHYFQGPPWTAGAFLKLQTSETKIKGKRGDEKAPLGW